MTMGGRGFHSGLSTNARQSATKGGRREHRNAALFKPRLEDSDETRAPLGPPAPEADGGVAGGCDDRLGVEHGHGRHPVRVSLEDTLWPRLRCRDAPGSDLCGAKETHRGQAGY